MSAKQLVYYVNRAGQQFGPFDLATFQNFIREGRLAATDYVWHTGLTSWLLYPDYVGNSSASLLGAAQVSRGASSRVSALLVPLRAAVRVPWSLLRTVGWLLTSPASFGREHIDVSARDLYRAATFYLNVFTIVFLSASVLVYFHGYSGTSQARELVRLTVQLGVAFPILYLFNRIARQPVYLSGIVQATLYADALFLAFCVPVSAGIAYATPPPVLGRGEVDIIATEFERCLAAESWVYWLLRGSDLQFFVGPAVTSATLSLETLKEYVQFVLVLPFCVIIGKLLNGRYGASTWLNSAFAIVTFVIVVVGYESAVDKIQTAAAVSSKCPSTFFEKAASKYSTQVLAVQIAARANERISRASKIYSLAVVYRDGKFVIDLLLKPDAPDTDETRHIFLKAGLAFYCGYDTEFKYARELGIPLRFTTRRHDHSILLAEEFGPPHCVHQ